MSFKTVAPVVVIPDIASKKASATVLTVPLSINGNIPNIAKRIHVIVTIKKESLISKLSILLLLYFVGFELLPAEIRIKPEIAVIIDHS